MPEKNSNQIVEISITQLRKIRTAAISHFEFAEEEYNDALRITYATAFWLLGRPDYLERLTTAQEEIGQKYAQCSETTLVGVPVERVARHLRKYAEDIRLDLTTVVKRVQIEGLDFERTLSSGPVWLAPLSTDFLAGTMLACSVKSKMDMLPVIVDPNLRSVLLPKEKDKLVGLEEIGLLVDNARWGETRTIIRLYIQDQLRPKKILSAVLWAK